MIGRAIRHSEDAGMVFLIDDRFDKYMDNRSELSAWCRDEFIEESEENILSRDID